MGLSRVDALVVVVVVIILSSNTDARRRRVDCTKFVFAPVCRGIAAKRGLVYPSIDESKDKSTWRESDRLGLDRNDYKVGSSSLATKLSLYDLLIALSKMELKNQQAGTDVRSSTDQILTPELADSAVDWATN